MKPIAGSITVLICCVAFTELLAAEVWDGPPISIVKEDGEQTIDNITPGVSLTRGGSGGVYNPVRVSSWTAVSPRGTEWAFAGINGNPDDASVTAANFENLTFDTWLLALGGTGMAGANIENRLGVLHLIDEDIYIDILFTFWEQGPTEEGNFSYTRSSQPALVVQAVPVPAATLGILLVTLVGLNWRIVRRSQ